LQKPVDKASFDTLFGATYNNGHDVLEWARFGFKPFQAGINNERDDRHRGVRFLSGEKKL
jgi:hypothetical protein